MKQVNHAILLMTVLSAAMSACAGRPGVDSTPKAVAGGQPVRVTDTAPPPETIPVADPIPTTEVEPLSILNPNANPLPDTTITVATCESAAKHVMPILNPTGLTEQNVVDECVRNNWSQELKTCYANIADAAAAAPCHALNDLEVSQARFAQLNINLAAKDAAATCYGGLGVDRDACKTACDDGFAAACYMLVGDVQPTTDGDRTALDRACHIAEEIVYADPARLPLTEDQRKLEIGLGYEACTALAAPAVAAPTTSTEAFADYALHACDISLELNNGTAATSCLGYGDIADYLGYYDNADWAWNAACNAGSAEACYALEMSWDIDW